MPPSDLFSHFGFYQESNTGPPNATYNVKFLLMLIFIIFLFGINKSYFIPLNLKSKNIY